MKENRGRRATAIVNHYIRDDQYEWLRNQGSHSVVMRELIDAAMYDPYIITGAQIAKIHRAVKELDALLTELARKTAEKRKGR